MRIQDIDKNFAVETETNHNMVRYNIPHPQFDLYGVQYDPKQQCFVRMDATVAQSISNNVSNLCRFTTGGRLRFRTDARKLELDVVYLGVGKMTHMALQGSAGLVLMEKKPSGEECLCARFVPNYDSPPQFHTSANLSGTMKDYILYFPLYNCVNDLSVSLNKEATLEKAGSYRPELPILYYGSSITQGGCASRPDTCYTAILAKWNDIDFLNLGFSGNAKGEPTMADYLASIPCSLFVCDYDHNAPDAAHLQNTHYALYDTFRRAQQDTPILFVTKPDGRRDRNDAKRVAVIRDTYKRAKAAGDKHVYFLDGKTFYPAKDNELCAVDGCHPTDLGFYFMAKKLYAKMIKIDEKFR